MHPRNIQGLDRGDHYQLKAAPLAGECQKVFVAAILAFHAGEAVVQVATIEITVYHLLDIGPPEPILPGEMLVIDLDKGFKIVPLRSGNHYSPSTRKKMSPMGDLQD